MSPWTCSSTSCPNPFLSRISFLLVPLNLDINPSVCYAKIKIQKMMSLSSYRLIFLFFKSCLLPSLPVTPVPPVLCLPVLSLLTVLWEQSKALAAPWCVTMLTASTFLALSSLDVLPSTLAIPSWMLLRGVFLCSFPSLSSYSVLH